MSEKTLKRIKRGLAGAIKHAKRERVKRTLRKAINAAREFKAYIEMQKPGVVRHHSIVKSDTAIDVRDTRSYKDATRWMVKAARLLEKIEKK